MHVANYAKYFGIARPHSPAYDTFLAVFTQKVPSPVTFAVLHVRIKSYNLTAQQQHKKKGLSLLSSSCCCLLQLVFLHLEQMLVQLVLFRGHSDDHPAEDGTDAARYRQRVPDTENFVGFLQKKLIVIYFQLSQIINLYRK